MAQAFLHRPRSPARNIGAICHLSLQPTFTPVITFQDTHLRHKMSEKTKGISLRKKRTNKKKNAAPIISAPRQISAPLSAGAGIAASTLSNSGRPSTESSRSRNREDAPQQRPQKADRTADLVKRRYSQKITTLPSDFSNGSMPDMPQIPSQFRDQPPPSNGRPTTSGEGRGPRVDMKVLRDPNLRADQCEASDRRNRFYVLI
jgi:hypothetical protein